MKVLYVEGGVGKDKKKESEGEVMVYDESKIATESRQDKTFVIAKTISNLKEAVSEEIMFKLEEEGLVKVECV